MPRKPARLSRPALCIPLTLLLAACGADRDDDDTDEAPARPGPARSTALPDAGLSGVSGHAPGPKAPDAGRPAPRRDAAPEPEPAPDAALAEPDGAPPVVSEPDAALAAPDAAPHTPDASPPAPDAEAPEAAPPAPEPDAAPLREPDAAPPAPEPDAAPPAPEPDAAPPPPPPPVWPAPPSFSPIACGGLPAYESEFIESEPDHWEMTVTPGRQHTAEGSCGGRGADLLLGFTAPATGEWTFAADADGQYPWVVSLRDTCDAPGSELACALMPGLRLPDPQPPVAGPGAAHLHLEAGQRVYLAADTELRLAGFGGAGFGGGYSFGDDATTPMTLHAVRVDAPTPPVLISARAFAYPHETLVVEVEVADADADAVAVEMTGTDADGNIVNADGQPLDAQRLPASALPGHPLGTARISLIRTPATQVTVTVIDALGGRSETRTLDLEAAPYQGPGDACDPSVPYWAQCGDGGRCTYHDGAADCVDEVPPVLGRARVFHSGGTLLLDLEGEDLNPLQTPGARVQLLGDADDTPLTVGPGHTDTLLGHMTHEGWGGMYIRPLRRMYTVWSGADRFVDAWAPQATRARVWLYDATGLEGEPTIVPITEENVRQPGQGCMQDGLGGHCAEGAACYLLGGYGFSMCGDPRPPVVVAAEAGRTPDGRLTVTARVAEGPHPVQEILFDLIDADGNVVEYIEAPGRPTTVYNVRQAVFAEGIWNFALRTGILLDTVPTAVGLRLTAFDADGHRPPPVDLPIVPMVPQAEGAGCDPLGVRSVCEAAFVCPAETQVCSAP